MLTVQTYIGKGYCATPLLPTAYRTANPAPRQDERQPILQRQTVQSPFQAALLFTAANQQAKPGRAAYVSYLNGNRVIAVERLHGLRGHNPSVNLDSVIRRVRRGWDADGVILATWVRSTSEHPYAVEFDEEVERQYHLLLEADIKLIDNLRISETGVYSYYGQHAGPFSDAPAYHQKSINRLY